MKHLIRHSLLLCCFLYTTGNLCAQKINFPKGKKFYYQTSYQDKLFKQDKQYTYSIESMGKDPNGNTVMECKIVKTLIRNDGNTLLNTDSIRNTKFNSTEVLFPLALQNKPIKLIISPKGKILSMDGVMQPLSAALDQWDLNTDIKSNILKDGQNNFMETLQRLFFQYPDKDINKVTEWENKDSGMKYKLTTDKGKQRIISSEKNSAQDMYVKNRYALDPATGLIQTGAEQYNFISKSVDGNGDTIRNQGEVLFTQKIINPPTPPKADPDWVNMATRLSYWSNALKLDPKSDTLKLLQTIANYGTSFPDDPYYLVAKLNKIQESRNRNNYKLYYDALMATPNKVLRGQDSHLHNKLGEALSKEGAASAMDVSKYVYDKESFSSWLQQSFAQNYIYEHEFDERAKIEKASDELIELFAAEKNPVYQEKVGAMYLWVKAKKEKQNAELQLSTAKKIIGLNDRQMLEGNGGRYALLIYSQLLQLDQSKEATALLDTTISKLIRYSSDEKNRTRYENQNILAHAYYLKYLSALKQDSANAIIFLSKAAAYSPKNNREKAYGSFYDRVFLKSKESYRQDYIDRLMNSGDEQEALKMIAVDINAHPENLPEMQKTYTTRFPDKDFKSFFIHDIVGSWSKAPDFKLKNIDGKEHSLIDFKGKWLVLDFWGTWCGPCKEELPSVNKFYTELASGQHGDINFLSIACHDQEGKVKSFITQNNYSMPVAMSDDKVERDYRITGYPSKILVSPDGKMLNVQFGKDWKAILKELNTIYAAN